MRNAASGRAWRRCGRAPATRSRRGDTEWLEDAYALVPLKGVGRAILRGALSLILASFAAIGFGIAYIVGCYLVHPVEGPIYSGWMAWVLLFSGFAGPFYATWKLLSLRDHHVPW